MFNSLDEDKEDVDAETTTSDHFPDRLNGAIQTIYTIHICDTYLRQSIGKAATAPPPTPTQATTAVKLPANSPAPLFSTYYG